MKWGTKLFEERQLQREEKVQKPKTRRLLLFPEIIKKSSMMEMSY